MDEATQNSFKADLEYLKAFEETEEKHIENLMRKIDKQDPFLRTRWLNQFETGFKEFSKLAELIFHNFKDINFNSDIFLLQVGYFMSDLKNLKLYLHVDNPDSVDLGVVGYYLSNIMESLKAIHEIVNLNFSNVSVSLNFLLTFFRI
jgi:hypothetical protein